MSKHSENGFYTTDLTLSVMASVARRLELDINDDEVANKLYWSCCDLESWDADHGFGTSDHYSYVQSARRDFGLLEEVPRTSSS